MKAWHFVGDMLRDGRPVPKDGELLFHPGPVIACKQGLHASEQPFDALLYAPGNILCLVELGEVVLRHGNPVNKVVSNKRTIIARMDAAPLLREFARQQALSRVHLWEPPQVMLDFLMGDDDARVAARDAVWAVEAAARDADRDARVAVWAAEAAVEAADRAAAWVAARDAWAAAEVAARDAAGAAVEAAAEAAARAAVWVADRAAAGAAAEAAARAAARAAAEAAARDADRAAARAAARDAARDAAGGAAELAARADRAAAEAADRDADRDAAGAAAEAAARAAARKDFNDMVYDAFEDWF